MRNTWLLAILFLAGCTDDPESQYLDGSDGMITIDDSKLSSAESALPIQIGASAREQIEGYNHFAIELYRASAPAKGDIFFSPASISAVLGMTQPGAAGATAEEFRQVLGNDGSEQAFRAQAELLRKSYYHVERRTLSTHSALWVDESLKLNSQFSAFMQDAYKAKVNRANFRTSSAAARKAINHLGRISTYGRIPQLVGKGDVTEETRLVLFNTIFFRAPWASEFYEGATRPKKFHRVDGSITEVPMMFQKGYFGHFRGPGFQMLSMPYLWGDAEMLVLLPERPDSLANLENSLNSVTLKKWLGRMEQAEGVEVEVSFPKFTLRQRSNLEKLMPQLGFATAFDRTQANFTNMVANGNAEPLFLSNLLHEAIIEVDEKGTVAAAATMEAADAAAEAIEEKPIIFNADHPFIFIVRDRRTGWILFVGRFTGFLPEQVAT